MAADAPHAAPAPRRPRYELLSQSTVAVVGLGKSGLAVVRFLLRRGATVLACDDRDRDALAAAPASRFHHLLATSRAAQQVVR